MLKNNLYVYSDEELFIPANLNYGELMLRRFVMFKDSVANLNPNTGETLTYQALAQQSVDIALSLARLGVTKGDTVAYISKNIEKFIPLAFGTIFCGAAITRIVWSGEALIKTQVELSKPFVIFCSAECYDTYEVTMRMAGCSRLVVYGNAQSPAMSFESFLTETACIDDFQVTPVEGWKDIALIRYSSGTTGLQKAIPWPHLSLCADVASYELMNKSIKGKLVAISDNYIYPLFNSLYAGAITCYGDVVEITKKYKVQVILAAPYHYYNMIQKLDSSNLSSVELLVTGSDIFKAELAKEFKGRFPNVKQIYDLYGMAEVGMICSSMLGQKGVKPNSVGCVVPGFILKVVDIETNKPVGANQRGEIRIKCSRIGPTPSSDLDEEGFYKTGDLGYYDEDKYFYIIDRIRFIIKHKSATVCPAEIEKILIQHPEVAEAAVVGTPTEKHDELPTGFVVLKKNSTVQPQEIVNFFVNKQVDHCRRLEGGVRVVESFPRNMREKVDRNALRKMLVE